MGGFSIKRFLCARCAIVVLSLYVFFRSRLINWLSQGQKWLQRGFFYSESEIYQSFIKGKISQRDFIPNRTIALSVHYRRVSNMMQFYCKFPYNQGFCFGHSSGGFNTMRSTAKGWVNQESVKAKVKAVQSRINLSEKSAGALAPHKEA